MKKVLVINLGRKHTDLAGQVVTFLSEKGLGVNVIEEMPLPEVAVTFNAFVFLTRYNSEKDVAMDRQYPTKVTIVLSEIVKWEDEDGSVIPINKNDALVLEKLHAAIIENGSEDFKRGDKFTFPRGRDNCDGYGTVVGNGRAVLLIQHSKHWYADKGAVPFRAKKLMPYLMQLAPVEVMLALDAANTVIFFDSFRE